jgi:hypothetical protein
MSTTTTRTQAQTQTQQTQARLPLALHPVITELHSLESVLGIYFHLGAPHWIPEPQDHHPLAGVDRSIIETESYTATVLSCATPGFLLTAARQRARHKPLAGGHNHPNRFKPKRDLEQKPADVNALRQMSSEQLCVKLREELRAYFRILLASQQAYWKEPAGFTWEKRHRAAALVLERLAHICAALRRKANRWYAEVCLRDALLELWEEFFGPNVPVGEWWKWLLPIEVPEKAEKRIAKRLAWEQSMRHGLPPQFLVMMAEWARGEYGTIPVKS